MADGAVYFGVGSSVTLVRLLADLLRNAVPVTTTIALETPVSEGPSQDLNLELAHLGSPAELRVYDSQGRVTGLTNGKAQNEIPKSIYYDQIETVVIFDATDIYHYEVVGMQEGTYSLMFVTTHEGETSPLVDLTNFPMSPGLVHEYTIDWTALARGKKGVTQRIDSDGDGTFERTILLPSITEGREGVPPWVWPASSAGVAFLVALTVSLLVLRKRPVIR